MTHILVTRSQLVNRCKERVPKQWCGIRKAALAIPFHTASLQHYSDVIMSAMASQITGVSIVYSTVCSGADQGKYQSSASLAFVRGSHRSPTQSASSAENVSIWYRHHGEQYQFVLNSLLNWQPVLVSHGWRDLMEFAAEGQHPGDTVVAAL